MNVLGTETKIQKHITSEDYTNIHVHMISHHIRIYIYIYIYMKPFVRIKICVCVCDKKKEIAHFKGES